MSTQQNSKAGHISPDTLANVPSQMATNVVPPPAGHLPPGMNLTYERRPVGAYLNFIVHIKNTLNRTRKVKFYWKIGGSTEWGWQLYFVPEGSPAAPGEETYGFNPVEVGFSVDCRLEEVP